MGILRCLTGEVADALREAASLPTMDSFLSTPPGTAAAKNPPPVVARNCLRSTDLLTRELRMPNPRNYPFNAGQIVTAALYASGRGSNKIVLAGRAVKNAPTEMAYTSRQRDYKPRWQLDQVLGLFAAQRVQCWNGNR